MSIQTVQDKWTTTEHWIQRITFAAEINAVCSRGSVDTHTARQRDVKRQVIT